MLTPVQKPPTMMIPMLLLKPHRSNGYGPARFGASIANQPDLTSQALVDTVVDLKVADVLQTKTASSTPSASPPPLPKKRRLLPKWVLLLGMALSIFIPDKPTIQRLMTGSSNGTSATPTWVSPPAPDATTGIIQHRNKVDNLNQYSTNGCGTTSLAMAQNTVTQTHKFNREVMDREVRRTDIYTAPESMVYAARAWGAHAEIYNNQTFEDIQRHVDLGNPVIVLNQTSKRGEFQFSGHYVVVSGYKIYPNGKRELICEDPAYGKTTAYDFAYFEKTWGNLDYGMVRPGFNNLMIVVSNDPLPPSNYGYNPLSMAATNVANLLHTSKSLLSLDLVTVGSRDLLNGNLFRLALLLAGGFFVLRPRKQGTTETDKPETSSTPDTVPIQSKPNQNRPAYRPKLTEWLTHNEPMVPA